VRITPMKDAYPQARNISTYVKGNRKFRAADYGKFLKNS